MRYLLTHIIIIAAVLCAAKAGAQTPEQVQLADGNFVELPDGRLKSIRGYYYTVVDGDSVKMNVLNTVTVFPPLKFKNRKEEEFYWKTVRDVKKTLPYAKLICATLLETYEYIETFPTQKEREDYLKKMEGEIFKQYKPVLKKFSKSQAQLLIKLIKRETDQSSYNIIKAFLGSFRAGFWQTFGRFFGVNLKGDYKPDKDRKDGIIERVAVGVELGML
ncbi:MAG: DUF4294 domain-containing protein [Paramuribaculum sp.]|nr:DUF4294 domain-containing protein [Paramuribaculum sp.]MDE6460516.1 DUF4294 domain-containing protein [Paramuribaculum sp.]